MISGGSDDSCESDGGESDNGESDGESEDVDSWLKIGKDTDHGVDGKTLNEESEATRRRGLSWLEAENTDTSDEEEVRNTLGNIPLEWYEDYDHLGYDVEGHKLSKPTSATSDEVMCVYMLG